MYIVQVCVRNARCRKYINAIWGQEKGRKLHKKRVIALKLHLLQYIYPCATWQWVQTDTLEELGRLLILHASLIGVLLLDNKGGQCQ